MNLDIDHSHESKQRRKKRQNKERMVKYRESKAISAGRRAGVVGRPPLILYCFSYSIEERIVFDANKGIFHQMSWLYQLVLDLNQIRGVPQEENYKPSKSWIYDFIKKNV
jgi:hypothetical protein